MPLRVLGLRILTILACALVVVLAAPAWAKRVAIVEFRGPKADKAQKVVAAIVARENTVISPQAWNKAVRETGVPGIDDASVAQVADSVKSDVVLFGVLAKNKRRFKLHIVVREGKTGTVVQRLEFPVRSQRIDSVERDQIAQELLPAISAVADLAGEPVVEAKPEPTPQETDVETPVPAPAPVVDEPAPRGADERLYRHAAVDAHVGISFVRRKLSFTFAEDLTDPQKPNGYNGAMVPAARIDLDVYPMAFGDKRGALAGIGIGLWFEKVIAIKSRLGMTEFPTSQTGFGAGLRYRWNMGNDAKLPTLTVGAGWSYLAFSISTDGVDIDLPDVSYSMIDAGIGGRIPFGMPQIALTLDARYLQILGAGDMQATSAYGGGSKLGFDLDAAIEARLAVRNVIRAGVHYTRIAFDFDGSGEDTTMRDGSPDQDVGGALDQYLGFYATFGYLF